jgi:small subunit ribosomal protein S1
MAMDWSKTLTFSHDDFLLALDQHDYTFEVGQTVHGKVVNHDSDGAYVDIGGKSTALLPTREIYIPDGDKIADVLPLQTEREFLIIRGQDADGQITVSVKQLEIKALWQKFQSLQDSQDAFDVKVTGVNKGGLTVDALGIRGFVPRSHVAGHPELESLVGQRFGVVVLEADPERRRLVCSQRLAVRQQRFQDFEIGQLVSGTVREIRSYGLMVDLAGAVGLLHINDFSEKRAGSLQSYVEVGTSIKAIITNLEPTRGRISLATRSLEHRPGEMLDAFDHVMAEAEQRSQRGSTAEPDAEADPALTE